MKYRISHRTHYVYSEPVTLCHNQAYLFPRNTNTQQCCHRHMEVTPQPTTQSLHKDFFGNHVSYFSIDYPHTALTVETSCEIELHPEREAYPTASVVWEEARDRIHHSREEETLDARQYTYDSPLARTDPALAAFVRPLFPTGRPLIEAVREFMEKIFTEFTYDPNVTTVSTPLLEVIESKRGVCQDFAHLAIGCLRSLQIPTRYVSGYIETLPPPGQEKLEGTDATHAWFSVYEPNWGWVDFDPTNNTIPQIQHIVTAWGRDYSDVSPIKGVIFGGGSNKLDVSVDVKRL